MKEVQNKYIKCTNGSLKRVRKEFPIKGIGKIINSAKELLELVPTKTVISECIYDTDNPPLYNVLIFLIRENCTDENIINELNKFKYEKVL